MTTVQYKSRLFSNTFNAIVDWYYLNSLLPVLLIDTTDLITANQATAAVATASRHTLMLANNSRMNLVNIFLVEAATQATLAALTTNTLGANTESATAVSGINLKVDVGSTDNAGLQMDSGIDASSPAAITVGTDTGGYIEATFFTSDWTKHDCVVIGYRKVAAIDASFGGLITTDSAANLPYSDVAVFGVVGASKKLQSWTDLNGVSGNTTPTDSTNEAVNSQNLKIRVSVSSTGVVTYKYEVNGLATSTDIAETTTVAAFTFDSTDIIIPFITIENVNSGSTDIFLKQLTIVKYE